MSIVCEACKSSNRDTAMFCIGCARRLPGFVATGPSMLETTRRGALTRPAIGTPIAAHPAGRVLEDDPRKRWLWLGAGASMLIAAFIAWLFLVARPASDGSQRVLPPAGVAITAPPSSPSLSRSNDTAQPEDRPTATPASPPTPPVAAAPAPVPADAPGPPLQRAAPSVVVPAATSKGEAARTVEKFYIALSFGDGSTAASLVTPDKRGIGPFSDAGMSRFYGSLRDPLALRSVRPLGGGRVQARYRYRATTTTCEGTAVIQTETVGDKTLIRSIRANC